MPIMRKAPKKPAATAGKWRGTSPESSPAGEALVRVSKASGDERPSTTSSGWLGSAAWAQKADRWSCCKCGGALQDPVLLSCLHSICKACLADHGQMGSFTCSKCQSRTTLAARETLAQDYLARDHLSLQELRNARSHVPFCEECADEERATCRCMECLQFLCDLHQAAHRKSKSTNTHELVDLDDLKSMTLQSSGGADDAIGGGPSSTTAATAAAGSGPSLHLAAGRVQMVCSSHGMKELELYCQTCSCCLCRDCIVVDHKNHDYTFVKDAMKKQDLMKYVEQAEAREKQLEATLAQVKEADDGLAGNFHKASDAITKAGDKMKKLIDQRCEQLKKDVDVIYQRKSTLLDGQKSKLQQLSDDLSYSTGFCRFTLEEGSSVQCMSLKSKMESRLSALSQQASSQTNVACVDSSLIVEFHMGAFEDALRESGHVTSFALASLCSVQVPESAYVGSDVVVGVNLFDGANQGTTKSKDSLQVSVFGPGHRQLPLTVKATRPGLQKEHHFKPSHPGPHVIHSALGDIPLADATLQVQRPPWCFSESVSHSSGYQHQDTYVLEMNKLAACFKSAGQQQQYYYGREDDGHWIIKGSKMLGKGDIRKWKILFGVGRPQHPGAKDASSQGRLAVGVAVIPSNSGIDLQSQPGYNLLCYSFYTFDNGSIMQGGRVSSTKGLKFSPGEELTLEYNDENGVLCISNSSGKSCNIMTMNPPDSQSKLPAYASAMTPNRQYRHHGAQRGNTVHPAEVLPIVLVDEEVAQSVALSF